MRIWVTGLGVVSPLGADAGRTFERLVGGDRGVGDLTLFDAAGCRSSLAAQVDGLRVADVAPRDEAEAWSRTDAMAVVAAREALGQARLAADEHPVDLVVGGTTAGMFETEDLLARMARDSDTLTPLRQMLSHPLSATADRLRQAAAPFRRARTVCSACSSGANALLLAANWLTSGRSTRVLAGGADGLCRLTYVGFSALGALSAEPCRPFDRRRDGLTLGEAAAFLVLETDEAARERGAEPLAELRGWATGTEAHHITHPQASGETAARVMQEALASAELDPTNIGYVNAHGTATPLNDAMEAKAVRAAFGDHSEALWVSSSKAQIGHTLGAAGAIEAAFCVHAITSGCVPPTAGLEQIDPDCALRHVTTARDVALDAALSSSFGFGGSDSAVVLAQPERFPDRKVRDSKRVLVTGGATLGTLGMNGITESGAYLQPGDGAGPGTIDFDASEHLDLGRARRIDRGARMLTATVIRALRECGAGDRLRYGAVSGTAFGSVDPAAAYVRRFLEKGVRFASPAVFPNLLLSSPVAHASIYVGLRGTVFASADLGATSEGAVTTAFELIRAGAADVLVAGGAEEVSRIAEQVLGPLCLLTGVEGERSEGVTLCVLESEQSATARDAAVVAELLFAADWRGPVHSALDALPATTERALVVAAQPSEELDAVLGATAWGEVERRFSSARCGWHTVAGGIALVAGLGAIASGERDSVLAVGLAPDRGYVLLFGRPR